MINNKIIGIALVACLLSSCNDFLTKDPLDTVTDTSDFWNNEDNVRTSVYNLYTTYFTGYNSGWSRSDWFSETNVADWTDDNAQQQATFFTKVAPATASSSAWSFTNVRSINVLINRITTSTLTEEAKNHWLGVTRFLRGMEYAKLVSRFGDVPYYDESPGNTDYEKLYKTRDPRAIVMDKVLDDLNFAAENVRISDGTAGLSVNRDVVNAFASRIMLFEGTWQKYRENSSSAATKYLTAAKKFAENVMDAKRYSISNDYKALTTSVDLAGNPEIIMYRSYVEGVVTHSLMSFQNTELEKNSPSRSFVDAFLSKNGLPIHQTSNIQYKGDKWFADEITNRDPRLYANIDTTGLRLIGVADVWAISGFFANRFVNESLINEAGGKSNTCITDAPIMKLNEVLMNYIEAAAELAALNSYTLTQNDFDKTINTLRDRTSTAMPHLQMAGSDLTVGGVKIDDPDRDSDVSAILWEIRRERRTELAYEGIRFNDIRRWGKLQYADMVQNKQLNKGAWIDKDRYVAWYNAHHTAHITVAALNSLVLDRAGNAGYIIPISDTSLLRTYADKDYLYPIPIDQITLYKSRGYELKQNPGW